MPFTDLSIALVSGVAALVCLRLAFRLFVYDKTEYDKSKARYRSAFDAIRGAAIVKVGDVPDGRVRAGLVFNKKFNRFEPNGKLNNDVIDKVLGV